LGLVTCSGLFFRIDPGKVKIVTFAMLFNRKTAAQAFDAWLAAENGDPSGLGSVVCRAHYTTASLWR